MTRSNDSQVWRMQVSPDGKVLPIYEGPSSYPDDSPGVLFKFPGYDWFVPQFPGEQPTAPESLGHCKQELPAVPLTEQPYLTVEAAETLLGMSHATLYSKWLTGEGLRHRPNGLRSFLLGGKRYITRDDLDDFMQRMRGQTWHDEAETKALSSIGKKRTAGKRA